MSADELTPSRVASLLGYREVPEILEASAPAIDRGHHLALLAADGSGKEAVFGLAVARDCDPGVGATQAIVVSPTRERAIRVGRAVHRICVETGIVALAPPVGPEDQLLIDEGRPAHCLVARPSHLLPAVRSGHLHLGDLRLIIVDGAADLAALEEWPSVEPLLDTLASETRRIVVTHRFDEALQDLLKHQLPRARRWPEELFAPPEGDEGPTRGPALDYAAAASAPARRALLEAWVRRARDSGGIRVRCFGRERAESVAAALCAWGHVAEADDPDVRVSGGETAPGAAVAYGLPLSLASLRAALEGARRRLAVVDPAHVSQLELLARRAGWVLHALPDLPPGEELDPIGIFRRRLQERIERANSDAELLVLEPLLREFGAVRVAAALSSLLRARGPAGADVKPWPDVEAVAQPPPAGHRGARSAWSKIYVAVGKRDDVRAADLVGAITGETGVAGAQIGRIDIRGSFSLVEIDSQVVEKVIRLLDGATIRGRQVSVRPDREA